MIIMPCPSPKTPNTCPGQAQPLELYQDNRECIGKLWPEFGGRLMGCGQRLERPSLYFLLVLWPGLACGAMYITATPTQRNHGLPFLSATKL